MYDVGEDASLPDQSYDQSYDPKDHWVVLHDQNGTITEHIRKISPAVSISVHDIKGDVVTIGGEDGSVTILDLSGKHP